MSSNYDSSSLTLVGLECPVCLLIPRKEIYQCSNGHSICHLCMANIEICPACRVAVSGSNTVKVRNLYAETFLDGMIFECNWKEQGCDALLPRGQLSEHEAICKFGTINLCKAFERSKNCQFQFSTMALDNPGTLQEVLEHMKNSHKFKTLDKLGWNLSKTVNLKLELLKNRKCLLIFQQVVSRNNQAPSSELFVVLLNFEEDQQEQVLFSVTFAMLTNETDGTNSAVEVKLSIKGQKSAEVCEYWGNKCVPDIAWTMKPVGVQKFKEFLNLPVEDRPPFPFTLPVSDILKNHVDSAGIFYIKYSFHKE